MHYQEVNQDYSLQNKLDELNKSMKDKRSEMKKSIVEKVKYGKNNIEKYNILRNELKLLIEQKMLIEKQLRKVLICYSKKEIL